MANSVSHFSHPHPVTMVSMNSTYRCDLCQKTGTGNRYRCSSPNCDFDLHEHCIANYPLSMDTSLHQEHSLICLQLDRNKRYYCDHCKQEAIGFVYSCRECNFDLHLDCAVFLRLRSQPSTNEVERSLGGLALGAGTGSNSSSRATIVPGAGGPGLGIPSNSSSQSQGGAYGNISNNYNPGRGYNNNINGGVNNFIRPGQSAGIPWPGVGGAEGGHVGHGHGRGLGTTLADSFVGGFGSKMGSTAAGGLIDSVSSHVGDTGRAGDAGHAGDAGDAGHVSDVSHTGDVNYAAGQVSSDAGHPSEASYGGYPGYDGHASDHVGNVSYVGNGAGDAGGVDYAGHAGNYANYAGQVGYGGYDGYAGNYASGVNHAGYANYGGGYADDEDDADGGDSYDF